MQSKLFKNLLYVTKEKEDFSTIALCFPRGTIVLALLEPI